MRIGFLSARKHLTRSVVTSSSVWKWTRLRLQLKVFKILDDLLSDGSSSVKAMVLFSTTENTGKGYIGSSG